MSRVSFEEFVKIAGTMGVREVTKEEYEKVYDERLTMKTVLSRIKYYRKPDTKKKGGGDDGPMLERKIMGFAMGARDVIGPNWSPPVTWDNTKEQYIEILGKDGEWQSYKKRGQFNGHHGRLHEFTLKKKENWKNWQLSSAVPDEEKWRPDRFKEWVDPSYLFSAINVNDDADMKYSRFFIKGEIAGIFALPDFDARDKAEKEDDDDNRRATYPINYYGGAPGCEIIFEAGSDKRVKCIFGRKKNAEPYVNLPDWNTEACPDLDALNASFQDQTVGIIGQYYKWDTWTDKDSGEDILQLVFFAHAIVALAEGKEEAAPEADEAVTKTAELFEAIEAVKKRVGPAGLTADAVRTKMGDNAPEEYLINAAIRKSKQKPGGNADPDGTTKKIYKLILLESDSPVKLDDILKELDGFGINEEEAEEKINKLIDAGEVWEPALGMIQATVNK